MRKLFVSLVFGCAFVAAFAGNGWCPAPCIDIEKLVSVDGGETWHDADTVGEAPETPVGQGALYKLIVENCGAVALTNVVINDPDLGIVDYPMGGLAVGQTVELDSGVIPALAQPERCAAEGELQNIASVSGSYETTQVTDSDPAWVKCLSVLIPCIDIEKEVSVDNGMTWHDADILGDAPTAPFGAGVLYRLIVSNCGDTDLTGVVINDPVLGIEDYVIGDLLVAGTVTLYDTDISALARPDLCMTYGEYENIASVEGYYGMTKVTDSDPAWVICPPRGDEGCTPGYWKQEQHFDSWVSYQPTDTFEEVFTRVITVTCREMRGRPSEVEGPTMVQALQAKGGGVNALARHAVAALLNAANPDVSYMYTVGEVIAMFQAAFDSGNYEMTKNLFEYANEFGCPLN